jgi:ribonuclease HI
MKVVAATDGSCIRNPGPGGWAWVIDVGGQASSYARSTTNNRMELRAVLELLKSTDPVDELLIYSDSDYVIRIFTGWLDKWRAKGTLARQKNLDLIPTTVPSRAAGGAAMGPRP